MEELTSIDRSRNIISRFGLDASQHEISRFGSGHINLTYRVSGKTDLILQRINIKVFTEPEVIAKNLRLAASYFQSHFPGYRFLSCIPSVSGLDLEYDDEGYPWRVFPYIENSVTYDQVDTTEQARQAAREFARLTRYLDGIDTSLFKPTIEHFHDLSTRWAQFDEALKNASAVSRSAAAHAIAGCQAAHTLVDRYQKLIAGSSLRLRIIHNDTKINNVLFDRTTGRTIAVIDLDTLMPGYFIYDLGDMVRTFVCPVSEEAADLARIVFRRDVYRGLLEGYLSEMDPVLTPEEKAAIPFAGKMMTYIMSLRFLADYLRGNTYYNITYPEQNLVRATNQLKLLEVLDANIPGA